MLGSLTQEPAMSWAVAGRFMRTQIEYINVNRGKNGNQPFYAKNPEGKLSIAFYPWLKRVIAGQNMMCNALAIEPFLP